MTTLDRESYDKVIDALEAADGEPREYSGRGMYGRACVAVVCHSPLSWLMAFAQSVCENASDTDEAREILEALADPRTDSWGRDSQILYFPSVEWQGDDDSEDDEDEVEVNTEDYTGSHGHDPGGDGEWMFYLGAADEECPDSLAGKKLFRHSGSYAQAKKAAKAAAREQGKGTVFVLS